MTSIGVERSRAGNAATRPQGRSVARRLLLACGAASSLLYVVTDLLGGLRHPGYSFTAQAISELGAIGAPSEALVAPLFFAYDVLALAFGAGVVLEGGGRARVLRIAGVLLLGHAIVGLAGAAVPQFFEMRQRGAGSLTSDAPHIVLTAAIVLLLLFAIAAGAFALGRWFRVYSFVTLLTFVAFGALTATYAPALAAGQPTPGLGIVERIDVYSSMLWIAVLAIALLRRPAHHATG